MRQMKIFERQIVMRPILLGVSTLQKRFHPYILTALILISITSSQFIDISTVNTDPKLIPQDQTGLNSLQPVASNHMIPSQHSASTPVSTPTSTLIPADGNGRSPSGQAMPSGDIAGWRQIFAEDFNTPVALGKFSSTVYGSEFTAYADGTKDTAGQQGAPSRYYPSKVVSVSNGLLNLYLHTENGTPMAAAILPNLPGNHLYGKFTIRFRSDALFGFKVAWLLWPDSGNWPQDGEIDFPESGLDQTISAFMHHQNGTSGSDQDTYNTTATYTSWHTASIEWSPNQVNFILDDQSIGTSTTRIPNTAMHWVIQTEACLPTCPAATTAGNLQIDWMVAYARA